MSRSRDFAGQLPCHVYTSKCEEEEEMEEEGEAHISRYSWVKRNRRMYMLLSKELLDTLPRSWLAAGMRSTLRLFTTSKLLDGFDSTLR